jgi:hypothetical protein
MPISSPKAIGIEGEPGAIKRQKIVQTPVAGKDCPPITKNRKGLLCLDFQPDCCSALF